MRLNILDNVCCPTWMCHMRRGDPAPLVAAQHALVRGRAPQRAVRQAARALPQVIGV